MSQAMEELKSNFADLIASRSLDQLEELWVGAIEAADDVAPPAVEPFIEAADAYLEAGLGDKLDVLLELTAPLYEEHGEPRLVAALLRRWCLAAPERDEARKGFLAAFRKAHGAASIEAVYAQLSDIAGAKDVAKAFVILDRWMLYRQGAYVHHGSGWGTGRIVELDPLMRRVTVDLEKKPKHVMDVAAMGSVLEPLPEDHVMALKYEGGERLREMAESEPVALVETVLRSFQNPMTLKAIKAELVPDVVGAKEWTKWWSRTKKALRESGSFRVGDRSPYRIERVEGELSYDDELVLAFERAAWSQRRTLARKALRDHGKEHPKLFEGVVRFLEERITATPDAEAVEAAYLLDRHVPRGEGPSRVGALLARVDDPVALVLAVQSPEDQKAAAARLHDLVGDAWPDVALRLLEHGQDLTREAVCEWATDPQLKDRVVRRIEAILESPRSAPNLFSWALRRAVDGHVDDFVRPLEELATLRLFQCVLDLSENLVLRAERDQDPQYREYLARLRAVVQHRSKALFRKIISTLDAATGRPLYERLLRLESFGAPMRVELLDVLVKSCPDVAKPVNVPIWEQTEIIYVTPRGIEQHRDELRALMEDALPAVFEDIGRAAAFGDLRENAEYHAALEKRDFLTKKGEQMRADLDKAVPITPEMLEHGRVTLGTKVSLRNVDTGQELSYSVLGPWDGSPEDGVISYASPLGRVFLGTYVGDTVTAELPSGTQRFEVLGIESVLDPEE